MEGFDDPGVFFSDNFGVEENESQDQINLQAVKKKFKEFIRQFHSGNFNFKYRYVQLYKFQVANCVIDRIKLCDSVSGMP